VNPNPARTAAIARIEIQIPMAFTLCSAHTLGDSRELDPPLDNHISPAPMALLELVKAPDPRLKLISEPVPEVDSKLRRFMTDMVETMYAGKRHRARRHPGGISPNGCAVIDLDPGGPASKPIYLVNPRIVEASGELSTYHEGCLSVPEVWDDVKRPAGADGRIHRLRTASFRR